MKKKNLLSAVRTKAIVLFLTAGVAVIPTYAEMSMPLAGNVAYVGVNDVSPMYAASTGVSAATPAVAVWLAATAAATLASAELADAAEQLARETAELTEATVDFVKALRQLAQETTKLGENPTESYIQLDIPSIRQERFLNQLD